MLMPTFKINNIFLPAFQTECRYVDLWGGRGRGGSYHATMHALINIIQPKYYRAYFIRKVFNDIRGSLWQDFKDRITESGLNIDSFHFNENEMTVIYKPTGNIIKSKGVKAEGQRTAKMKSLAGATHVYIEEADELEEGEFDQLDISVRTKKSKNQIFRIFNPPTKKHWIWRDYWLFESGKENYLTAKLKDNSDFLSIFSDYKCNILNLDEAGIRKFEAFQQTDEEYYNTVILGLIGEGKRGRIYKHFQPISETEYAAIQAQTVYIIDFGYSSDPTCVLEIKKAGNTRYAKELIYEAGLDNLDLAKKLIDKGLSYKNRIYADFGAGGDVRIAELIRGYKNIEGYEMLSKGFNAIPVKKGTGSIATGISLVKSHQWFITENSTNTWKEAGSYSWALDRDKNPTDQPVDKDNHAMDCIRYFDLIADYI